MWSGCGKTWAELGISSPWITGLTQASSIYQLTFQRRLSAGVTLLQEHDFAANNSITPCYSSQSGLEESVRALALSHRGHWYVTKHLTSSIPSRCSGAGGRRLSVPRYPTGLELKSSRLLRTLSWGHQSLGPQMNTCHSNHLKCAPSLSQKLSPTQKARPGRFFLRNLNVCGPLVCVLPCWRRSVAAGITPECYKF